MGMIINAKLHFSSLAHVCLNAIRGNTAPAPALQDYLPVQNSPSQAPPLESWPVSPLLPVPS